MDFSIIIIIIQLIFLEGILSIDNAAVLGAMVNTLPAKEPIPWPGRFHLVHAFDRILGQQRTAAFKGRLNRRISRSWFNALHGKLHHHQPVVKNYRSRISDPAGIG